jgi:hypothetical protein
MSFDLYYAKALVAVGMNGDMVILTASSDSQILGDNAKFVPAKQLLNSSSVPLAPGLYEFNGSTRGDFLENCARDSVHVGQFELVSSYAIY